MSLAKKDNSLLSVLLQHWLCIYKRVTLDKTISCIALQINSRWSLLVTTYLLSGDRCTLLGWYSGCVDVGGGGGGGGLSRYPVSSILGLIILVLWLGYGGLIGCPSLVYIIGPGAPGLWWYCTALPSGWSPGDCNTKSKMFDAEFHENPVLCHKEMKLAEGSLRSTLMNAKEEVTSSISLHR